MAKTKENKAATTEDIKRISVEAPKDGEVEKEPENPSPITAPVDEVVAPAQAGSVNTPVVDIQHTDGKVEAVEVKADESSEADEKVAALEKELNDYKTKMRAADKRVGDLLKEVDRLNKVIVESPAEKLRAELEVARREYELLLGNQQKPPKQIFG